LAREYDKAIAQLRASVAMDPFFWLAHSNLASAYERKGMYSDAAREYQKAVDLTQQSTRQRLGLARVWALTGRQADARKARSELEKALPSNGAEATPFALLDLALGEPDRAVARIRSACAARQPRDLSHSPYYDPLWADAKTRAVMSACAGE
jgi:Flp pilus assembly protein TadD